MLSYITHRGPAKEVFSFPKPLGFLILHKDIHLHLVYGQRSKLKPGNRLQMLFMQRVVYSFVRFGMWEEFQIKGCCSSH
ncbi:hypothetical protein CsSME_00028606 [Camellia sinensis var. sinensis]